MKEETYTNIMSFVYYTGISAIFLGIIAVVIAMVMDLFILTFDGIITMIALKYAGASMCIIGFALLMGYFAGKLVEKWIDSFEIKNLA